jgi:hypothetical protein
MFCGASNRPQTIARPDSNSDLRERAESRTSRFISKSLACDMLNRHESYETIAYHVANRSATSTLSHEDAAGFIGRANVTLGER